MRGGQIRSDGTFHDRPALVTRSHDRRTQETYVANERQAARRPCRADAQGAREGRPQAAQPDLPRDRGGRHRADRSRRLRDQERERQEQAGDQGHQPQRCDQGLRHRLRHRGRWRHGPRRAPSRSRSSSTKTSSAPPACQFEQQSNAFLKEQVKSGAITITFRPFSFLDENGGSPNEYSHRSTNVALCALDAGGVTDYVKAHDLLYANQPEEQTNGPENKELLATIETAGITGIDECVRAQGRVRPVDRQGQGSRRPTEVSTAPRPSTSTARRSRHRRRQRCSRPSTRPRRPGSASAQGEHLSAKSGTLLASCTTLGRTNESGFLKWCLVLLEG